MADAKERILQAASQLFKDNGYQDVTLRHIADNAGVKASIIIRHFGSKESLFLRTLHHGSSKEDLIKGPIDGLGERIVAGLLKSSSQQDPTSQKMSVLLKAITNEQLKFEMLNMSHDHLIKPLVLLMEGDDKELRASLISAQIIGLMLYISVLDDPLLLEKSKHKLIKRYGSAIQDLLDSKD